VLSASDLQASSGASGVASRCASRVSTRALFGRRPHAPLFHGPGHSYAQGPRLCYATVLARILQLLSPPPWETLALSRGAPTGLLMPRATPQTSPHARRHAHDACCPQSPRPLWREPLGLAADPDTLALPWVLASLAPPPTVARLLWWRLEACQRTPLRETTGVSCGEKYPCTLGRNTLVPWGEIPLYLGEKYPCTSWRSGLGPWGEAPLYLEAKQHDLSACVPMRYAP
jgi:hypothetical protein